MKKKILISSILCMILLTILAIHNLSKPKGHVNKGSCLPALSNAIKELRDFSIANGILPDRSQVWVAVKLPREISDLLSYYDSTNSVDIPSPNTAVFKCNLPVPIKGEKNGFYYALMSGALVVTSGETEYLGTEIPAGAIYKIMRSANGE